LVIVFGGSGVQTPKVRLYVESFKKAVGTESVVVDKPTVQFIGGKTGGATMRIFPTHDVITTTKYEYILPEEQERLVEIVKEVVFKLMLQLEVVDVTQRDFFDEPLPKEVKAFKSFPVLATESETRLVTNYSREDVEKFLAHTRRQ
jgi:hypothetical protein